MKTIAIASIVAALGPLGCTTPSQERPTAGAATQAQARSGAEGEEKVGSSTEPAAADSVESAARDDAPAAGEAQAASNGEPVEPVEPPAIREGDVGPHGLTARD